MIYELLDQIVALLCDFVFDHPFTHAKVSEGAESKAPHLLPCFSIREQDAWKTTLVVHVFSQCQDDKHKSELY